MRREASRRWCVLAVLGVWTWAAPGFAALKTAKPPDEETAWLNWAVTLVLGAVCAFVAFKNAKRSHQD